MRPLETIRGFLYGLTGLEFERQALEMRGSLETIFFVTTLGDMLGLPIIPPVYSLRVLPYAVPHIATWKRRGVRGREFSDPESTRLNSRHPVKSHAVLFFKKKKMMYAHRPRGGHEVQCHTINA